MSFDVEKKYGAIEYGDSIDDREASEVYRVISSTANPTMQEVKDAQGLPPRGESYPGDYWLQVKSRQIKQITDYLFEVTCEYRLPDASDSGGDDDGDPFSTPTQVTFGTVLYQEYMDQDAEGEFVETAVQEPFDPGITTDQDDVTVTVAKNFATFSFATMVKFQNKCNSAEWYGLTPYTARVIGIGAEVVRGEGNVVLYYRVSVTIQIRDTTDPGGSPVGWRARVKHQGFLVWDGTIDDDGARRIAHYRDSDDNRVTEPVPLTADGKILPAGSDPTFLLFKPYKEVDFNQMNLGI